MMVTSIDSGFVSPGAVTRVAVGVCGSILWGVSSVIGIKSKSNHRCTQMLSERDRPAEPRSYHVRLFPPRMRHGRVMRITTRPMALFGGCNDPR